MAQHTTGYDTSAGAVTTPHYDGRIATNATKHGLTYDTDSATLCTVAANNAEYLRNRRLLAIERGMCGICRCRPAKPGRKTCQVCLDRRYAYGKTKLGRRSENRYRSRLGMRQREERRGAGTCIRCGKYPAAPERASCVDCLALVAWRNFVAYWRDRVFAWVAQGVAGSGV